MASSKIKGITIEIGGNTTKLESALKDVNKVVYSTNTELKELNKALKVDPKNTELLAQKHELLKKNIEATTDKLNTLKEAQKQMGSYNKLTDEQKESYRALSVEISKSESALKKMNDEAKSTNKVDFSQITKGLQKVGDIALDVTKKVAQVTAAVGAALGGIVAAGVKSYADLETAQKGAERLFGDSFDVVEKNASKAYKSLGLSATEYYDQVNTYAVGLKEALDGDSKAAAELSNSILEAQSDIVAATGASQEQVQSAFSAVMRGNYTMLDNLRLGIKGSKEGMQEVIDKVNEWNKANGNATNYQMDNYADMQQALVDYTKMVGVAGTAQKQMSSTISGSVTQMKAAFNNFLNGSGGAEDLADAIINVFSNISNVIVDLAPKLLNGLVELINKIIPKLANIINMILPSLITAAFDIMQKLMDSIVENIQPIMKMVSDLANNIVLFILNNLPLILDAGLKILLALISGIADNLDVIIPAIVECVFVIVETLIDNIDLIIDAGVKVIFGLIKGIVQSIPKLIAKIPELVGKMLSAFTELIPQFFNIGGQILSGIISGLMNIGSKIKDAIKSVGEKIKNGFKSFFGINSPSRLMSDEVGTYIGEGVTEGIVDGLEDTESKVNNAMRELAGGIEASVNPTINPTANTNPLIIQIENFNNNSESDIQELAQKLEFYRRNSALARGDN